YVTADVAAVVELAHVKNVRVKVIFENCFLQDEHKERLCRICGEVRADFVKTSTGYGDAGATDDDLKLMRRCAPPHVQVKAAGGVRTFERLLAVRGLGVTRVGATASKPILDECKARLGGEGGGDGPLRPRLRGVGRVAEWVGLLRQPERPAEHTRGKPALLRPGHCVAPAPAPQDVEARGLAARVHQPVLGDA